MKNIINQEYEIEMLNRLKWLDEKDKPRWGKMNVNEMVCHVSDQVRLALELKSAEYAGNKIQEKFLKHLVLLGVPAPKGKVETVKELKQGNGGTKPIEFYSNKDELITLIKKFSVAFNERETVQHPMFGYLNKKEWGRIIYTHLNHHLKQFGK
ncbi:MAG: DUF1569 domain-containing protein [Bacteroidetes bacterium]|nr:DUF1569 domain-containing protein [Bacteroidota bacterium]